MPPLFKSRKVAISIAIICGIMCVPLLALMVLLLKLTIIPFIFGGWSPTPIGFQDADGTICMVEMWRLLVILLFDIIFICALGASIYFLAFKKCEETARVEEA